MMTPERAARRLEDLGFKISDGDLKMLDWLLCGARSRIETELGRDRVPQELWPLVVDMTAGEFVFCRKSMGRLEEFDLDYAVKQLQEGDTSVTYAVGEGSLTPEQRLDFLIDRLTRVSPSLLAAWRKMRW